MRGRDGAAERAGWSFTNFLDGINAASRTRWSFSGAIEFDVRRQVVGEIDAVAIG